MEIRKHNLLLHTVTPPTNMSDRRRRPGMSKASKGNRCEQASGVRLHPPLHWERVKSLSSLQGYFTEPLRVMFFSVMMLHFCKKFTLYFTHALFFKLSLHAHKLLSRPLIAVSKFHNLSIDTSECQALKKRNKILYVLNERKVWNFFSISTIIIFSPQAKYQGRYFYNLG